LPLIAFREAMIVKATNEAIRAYSIAVAPDSSARNRFARSNMIVLGLRALIALICAAHVIEQFFPSG